MKSVSHIRMNANTGEQNHKASMHGDNLGAEPLALQVVVDVGSGGERKEESKNQPPTGMLAIWALTLWASKLRSV